MSQSAENDAPEWRTVPPPVPGCVCEATDYGRVRFLATTPAPFRPKGPTMSEQPGGEVDVTGPTCADCGHVHTATGCAGPPTLSDRWAGVTPAVCDCPTPPESSAR